MNVKELGDDLTMLLGKPWGNITEYSAVLGKDWRWVAQLLADVPVADKTMKRENWYARDVAKVMVARQRMEATRDEYR